MGPTRSASHQPGSPARSSLRQSGSRSRSPLQDRALGDTPRRNQKLAWRQRVHSWLPRRSRSRSLSPSLGGFCREEAGEAAESLLADEDDDLPLAALKQENKSSPPGV